MAGAYNQNIIKFLKENADENDRFYVIGQTGYRALYHKDPRLVGGFPLRCHGAYAAACPRYHDGRHR